MSELVQRPRRLRQSPLMRSLVRETRLNTDGLVLPLFLSETVKGRQPVPSMPGVAETDLDGLLVDVEDALNKGVRSLLLFGVPAEKDLQGSSAWSEDGVVQKGLRALRKRFGSDLLLIADTCLCHYTSHGHCGVLTASAVDNDLTLEILGKVALSQAQAGADIVAPSGMIDGMVGEIRDGLDDGNFQQTAIMSYAVKYASALYGPFRDAAHSTPSQGDRKAQQMDPANSREALKEAALDLDEGADILMVKPALSYLDIIHQLSGAFAVPISAYLVSGEYAMIKAAAQNGWIDEAAVAYEHHLSLNRAGASIVLTYYARELMTWLKEGRVG